MNKSKVQSPKSKVGVFLLAVCCFILPAEAQTIDVTNKYGKVWIIAEEVDKFTVEPTNEVEISANKIVVKPKTEKARIDIVVKVPLRSFVRVQTDAGEVKIGGNVANAEVKTETGTIYTEIPLDDLTYNLLWTASRPRFLSDFKLEEVKEKNAGRFEVKGNWQAEIATNETDRQSDDAAKNTNDEGQKAKDKAQSSKNISLNLTTARGIILLNVKPSETPSDLRERPLTEASKAIVRSGDSMLMEAIRKSSPKYFGDYAKTLPPLKREPDLSQAKPNNNTANSAYKRVTVKVVDENNRSVSNLTAKDITITESGKPREVLEIQTSTAPFNLVLLLDVSGSIENYVDFIRKTARQFVNTMNKDDKISIVTFRDDVKVISKFTTDREKLSKSLDTFDAGGGTAYYDAVAFSLVETLRPLHGERTAIIAITDGDDNRSFLPFDALLSSIEESGALIYPLYVPSELIASSSTASQDSLRTKYLGLTSKAQGEGEKLAKISGGVYYQIKRLEDLQKAYDDIVVQLRTAYNVTFRSETAELGSRSTPRLKVKINRGNVYASLGEISELSPAEYQKFEPKEESEIIEGIGENEIRGEFENIGYKQFAGGKLREVKIDKLNFNNSPNSFILTDNENKLAVSRLLSPNQTAGNVYETFGFEGKKVAVIPVIKDEGLGGERELLQWDIISLLSLLDVHIVLAYYDEAVKNTKQKDQIKLQKLDNEFVLSKLREVLKFTGTSREWNENEVKNLKNILVTAKESYAGISEKTKTSLHNSDSIDELINFAETPQKFIEFSRQKSDKAQMPKEAFESENRINITNTLFGQYFFTCDETKIEDDAVWLIETKHSKNSVLPSESDIKNGLLKMMIYANLRNVKFGRKSVESKSALKLTSSKIVGSITSDASKTEFADFCKANLLNVKTKEFLTELFREAKENKFTIILEKGAAEK